MAVAATAFNPLHRPQIPKKRLSLSGEPPDLHFALNVYILRIRLSYTFGVGLGWSWVK